MQWIWKENLKNSQSRMKTWYDKKAKQRNFHVGEKALALCLSQANHSKPGIMSLMMWLRKLMKWTRYILSTPGCRKSERLCHVNMLKEYHQRPEKMKSGGMKVAAVVGCVTESVRGKQPEEQEDVLAGNPKLKNSEILKELSFHIWFLQNKVSWCSLYLSCQAISGHSFSD